MGGHVFALNNRCSRMGFVRISKEIFPEAGDRVGNFPLVIL